LGERVAAQVYKAENMAVGIHFADHATPFISKKVALTSNADADLQMKMQEVHEYRTEAPTKITDMVCLEMGFGCMNLYMSVLNLN
jgi:hypothetical protein